MKNVFEANPNEKELIVFPDGTCFLTKSQNDADNYAQKTKQEYKKVTKDALAQEEGEGEKLKNKTKK